MRDFLKIISLIIIFLVAGVYVVNYEATGDLEFTTQSTKLYSTPEKNEVICTLKTGSKVYSLTYYTDDGMDKVRYTDSKTNKKIVGFVEEKYVAWYSFPDQSVDTLGKPIVLSTYKDASLSTFIDRLVSLLDENSLIGVYVDTDSDKMSEIINFCDEQHIPYGYITTFDDTAYEVYTSNEMYSTATYNILPQVFRITSNNINLNLKKYDLQNCILSVTDSSTPDDSYNYWVTINSSSRNASVFDENSSIMAYKYNSDSNFGYSYISDEFEAQIERAYD